MTTNNEISIAKTTAIALGGFALGRLLWRKMKEYDLRDKTVLVTGGSRGLGLVLAREFAANDARVAICARDEQELEQASDDLQSRGADVLAVKCDVTNMTEVEAMMNRVRQRFGKVDVLVNNAGTIQVGPLEVMNREDFEKAMLAHFWGPLNTILAVLPEMRERGHGRIVNISSIGGKIAVPHLVPYSASKFALVGLSKGLYSELRKDGIVVTTVCPGLMRTGSPRNANFKGKHREEFAWFSISDSLPVTSIKAERAARQIVDACKQGRAELIITAPAKMAVKFDALFPELSAEMLALVNRFLPGPGGIGEQSAKGRDSRSSWSPSWLTRLTEEAAMNNNEVVH
ncbi:MAG TPA: SDR family oxidoreductase [Pyrinomonadaceae bacterium]|jgi:NAD(P)-dependent dehydrogenase (short-subunit alcohol dehydrogenase family)|nr:SDR family oxidoreductase [Pyrinomonadaceae bacterium]